MKCLSSLSLFFIFTFFACENVPIQKPETRIIEYPVPFYDWSDTMKSDVFFGIQTAKFIYVCNFEGAWLLYDKRIESNQILNVVNLDEYIFIQSDLEIQLRELLKIRNYNRNFINIKSSPWEK